MLSIAAPVLRAPDDPGHRGLWGIVALMLLVALVAAHVRVLRAVARQLEASTEAASSQEVVPEDDGDAGAPAVESGAHPQAGDAEQPQRSR